MTAKEGKRLGGGENEQNGKRIHVCGQECGDCRREKGIRRLNSNRKKYNKNIIKK